MSDTKSKKNGITVSCRTEPGTGADRCLTEKCPDPCTIVIMGATGDLTARKLIPALYNLFLNCGLPEPFAIVGCGRTDLDDRQFREKMGNALKESGMDLKDGLPVFLESIYYRRVEYDDPSTYDGLAESLGSLDRRLETGGNRIFYLALPPSLYLPVARGLGRAGLSTEAADTNGWSRLVVEKPFGRDLASAVALDEGIHDFFKEHQVFRIDHYLAKETVQNVLMFRFANAIFEPIWNRRYIDSVRIMATETLGVEHRAGYYEQSGVLRDMFQNHMMQLLALIAMEPPSVFEADRVRDEKVKVYRALRPFPVERIEDFLVLGQYGAGTVGGRDLPAYREEPGVKADSLTPTYAMMKVYLDNWRWQGVPFYLVSGKRLEKKKTEIAIEFKPVPHALFRSVLGEEIVANRLILGIYPEEEIKLTFQTKTPGPAVNLRSVTMDFHYYGDSGGPVLDAYEKVLLDCMLGDHMLFWRQDSVEICWAFLTPILEACEVCGDRSGRLHEYPAGARGPKAAEKL